MHKGQLVGEYILDRKLGAGGFGEVWLGIHNVWRHRQVAVKIPTNPDHIRQLKNEGIVHGDLTRLQSPHLVKVLGLNLQSTPPYMLMEYIDGRDLRQHLNQTERLSLKEASEILRQMILALEVSHAAGVVHGDIKPENILLSSDGLAKLTDFNLCRVQDWRQSLELSVDSSTEEIARWAGTFLYMSPEQRKGESLDCRSDFYSLALVLFEMLTGELPQPGDKLGDFREDIPPYIEELFRRCFTRLERRIADASEMLSLLSGDKPAQAVVTDRKPAQTHDVQKALNDLKPAATVSSPAPYASLRRIPEIATAMLLYARGDYKSAVAEFQRVIKEMPSHSEAWRGLSLAQYKAGEMTDAFKSATKVVKLRPKSAEARNQLGCVLNVTGKFKEATSSFKKAIKLKPNYASAHNNLAVALKALGRNREAEAALAQARMLDPDNLQVSYNIAFS